MDKKIDVTEALPDFYLKYAGYVIQTRSLCDSRDFLKTGARHILYAQYKDKLTIDKPRKKAVATVSSAMRFSPHGDASIYGTAVRMAQPFSLRYPVMEVQGNYGSLANGDDFSAARYLEMRSNKIANEMTQLLNKDTIDEWKLNYTQEEKYPSVLPSKFPYFVNGNTGIGVGCASSVPQFNLNDVVAASIKLLHDDAISFEDIYCPIDFATGGTIINEEEVKQSLKNGKGRAAAIRAKIEYDKSTNELIVRELPYQVFTSSIVVQLQKAIDEDLITGIESFFDGTDFEGIKIRIKLTKGAIPEMVCRQLYKKTSLQSYYSINMMMLEDGLVPRIFGFKEIISSYLNHLKMVMQKSYEFDLQKIKNRIEILEGYIKTIAHIEEIVEIIKTSSSVEGAKASLIKQFSFSITQVDAILDLKLQRLVKLEGIKIEQELKELSAEGSRITNILEQPTLFNAEIEKELTRIKTAYGDARRTTNINLTISEVVDEEPIEIKTLAIHLTNFGNLFTLENTTLLSQKRGGRGTSVKMGNNETIVDSVIGENIGYILAFSNKGRAHRISMQEIVPDTYLSLSEKLTLEKGERITNILSLNRLTVDEYIVFITKQGMVKKSSLDIYSFKTSSSMAIRLRENDEIVRIEFMKEEKLAMLSKNGRFAIFPTHDIAPIGRLTTGVIGMRLDDGDEIIEARMIPNDTEFITSISKEGLIKKTPLSECIMSNRAVKGFLLQKVKENDNLISFLPLSPSDTHVSVISNKAIIKFPTQDIPILSKTACGISSQKLKDGESIQSFTKE